jgi:hypothetical protein
MGPPPHPLTPKPVLLPLPFRFNGGRHTRLRERGWGVPNSDEGTDALVLYVYYNPSTGRTHGSFIEILMERKSLIYLLRPTCVVNAIDLSVARKKITHNTHNTKPM